MLQIIKEDSEQITDVLAKLDSIVTPMPDEDLSGVNDDENDVSENGIIQEDVNDNIE